MRTIKFLLAILFGIVVAACGGGGGGSGSPAPATYTISGTITGASGVVAVGLSGDATKTTNAAANGTYSFTGLANGSYTVTPTLAGYAFSPTSTAVSVSGANVTGKDFTATVAATTYSISGSAGIAGATITLSGANSGSVTTSTGGAYTITGLINGSYTVTPSLTGYTFAPTSANVTISGGNATATTFVPTANPVAHTLTGNVSTSLAGVTITVTGTGAPAPVTTNSSGNYSVSLFDGSYTVTPSKVGYTFTPVSASVTMSGANKTQNFTGTANSSVTATVSGTVTGVWHEGVKITMSNGATGTTTTNASGNYSFNLASGASYTFTPSLTGYTYSPASQTISIAAGSSVAVTVPALVASSAVTSYSISGTVSYAGSATGPIYLRVYDSGCTNNCSASAGTYIAAPGAYTIRGLQNGNSYVVTAEMDTLGKGAPNANNPSGTLTTATISSADLTGQNITIADPTAPAPVTPTIQGVSPGNGSAFILYSPPMDANGREIATTYKIYYGTTAAASDGTKTFAAQGDKQNVYVLGGLTDTNALYVKMSAFVGATESTLSAASTPVTVGATTGANTVSGTVTFPGAATGPMIVGVFSNGGIYFKKYASPVSPLSYSIAGVVSGTYQSFAVLDMNNNGVIDTGDLSNTNNNTPSITVSGATTSNLTLTSATTATVNTDHQFDGSTNSYSLNLGINDGIKRSVAVTLISGKNVAVPFDMGADTSNNSINLWLNTTVPTVGDSYVFRVTYSDGTTQDITGSVTGVLGTNALAQSLATVTNGTGGSSTSVPLFTWAAPSTPPASFTYRLNLYGSDANWNYPKDNGMPSNTTPLQVLYNADGKASKSSLTTAIIYTWQVQVRDANRNTATSSTTYSY